MKYSVRDLRLSGRFSALAGLCAVGWAASQAGAEPPLPTGQGQYTLCAKSITVPNHVAEAKRIKDRIVAITGLKGFYVVSSDTQSTIFYGSYESLDAGGVEAERARGDRKKLASLVDDTGARIFDQVFFMPVVQPDPPAPPEWDLRRSKGYYTLEIAAYRGDSRRKQAAVDAVAEARKMGIDAYYYHGEAVSSVCIGTWPREAVRITMNGEASAGPGTGVLVLPFASQDAGKEIVDEHGERMKVVAPPTVEVLDPTLRAALSQYKEFAVNGEVRMVEQKNPQTGEVQRLPAQPSRLIQIPRDGLVEQMKRATGDPADINKNAPALPVTPNQTPGAGKLQGIK